MARKEFGFTFKIAGTTSSINDLSKLELELKDVRDTMRSIKKERDILKGLKQDTSLLEKNLGMLKSQELGLKDAIRETNKDVKAQRDLFKKKTSGSFYVQLEAEIQQLTNQYKLLSKEEVESSKGTGIVNAIQMRKQRMKELTDAIKLQTKAVQDEQAVSNQTGKVGYYEQLEREVKDLTAELKGLNEAQAKGADGDRLKRAIVDRKKELSDLRNETKLNTVEMNRMRRIAEKKASGSYFKTLEAEVEELTNEFKNLNREQAKGARGTALSKTIRARRDELNQMSLQLGDTSRNVGNYRIAIEQALQGQGSFIGNMGLATKSLIRYAGPLGLAVVGGRKIVQTFKDINEVSKDYEQRFAKVVSVTGLTGKSVEVLDEQIQKVAQSLNKYAGDTADAFALVGSAAPQLLKFPEQLGKVTQEAITLQRAAGLELEESVDAVTKTMNIYRLDTARAGEVTDIFATAQQKGTARVNNLFESLVKVGPVASNLGINLEDTVTLLQGLAAGGLEGAKAGTQLRGVLLSLVEAGGQFNPEGKSAVDIVNSLKDASLGAREELKLFGRENLAAGQTLRQQSAIIESLNGQLNEYGNAAEQAAINTNTRAAAEEKATAAYKNLIVSIDNGSGIISKAGKAWLDWKIGILNLTTALNEGKVGFLDYLAALKDGGKQVLASIELMELAKNAEPFGGFNSVATAKQVADYKDAFDSIVQLQKDIASESKKIQTPQVQARLEKLQAELDLAKQTRQQINDDVRADLTTRLGDQADRYNELEASIQATAKAKRMLRKEGATDNQIEAKEKELQELKIQRQELLNKALRTTGDLGGNDDSGDDDTTTEKKLTGAKLLRKEIAELNEEIELIGNSDPTKLIQKVGELTSKQEQLKMFTDTVENLKSSMMALAEVAAEPFDYEPLVELEGRDALVDVITETEDMIANATDLNFELRLQTRLAAARLALKQWDEEVQKEYDKRLAELTKPATIQTGFEVAADENDLTKNPPKLTVKPEIPENDTSLISRIQDDLNEAFGEEGGAQIFAAIQEGIVIAQQALSQVFDSEIQAVEARRDAEVDSINEVYGARIAAAEGNKQLEESLEIEKDKKIRKINEQAAKDKQAIRIKEAIATAAVAIIQALANNALPFPSSLVAPGIIAAQTAVQIAAIKKQKFADGGFTKPIFGLGPDETGKRPAGIVHEKEFVMSEAQINRYPWLANWLEMDRKKFLRGFADGGFTSRIASTVPGNIPTRALMDDGPAPGPAMLSDAQIDTLANKINDSQLDVPAAIKAMVDGVAAALDEDRELKARKRIADENFTA